MNISIGGGQYFSNCDADFATMKTAIDNLRSVNIATAIASGNDYYTNAVAAPGCISTAITVGATDNSDAVANFSNSSPQVDLYAPGVSVYAAVPGGGYGYKSGTSMATPHVVGSIATMKAANPALTVAQEESFLGSSGPLVTDSKSGLQRHRINVLQAMGQETISLTNDVVRDLRNPIPYDHRFATQSTNGYWSAVAIRPPSGSDYDLTVYDNSNVTGYLATSNYGGDTIDFVAQDNNSGRRAFPDATYPLVHKFAGSGRYQIEYANDVSVLSDSTSSISMGSSEVIEIRDTFQASGQPTYYRVVPSNGGQDPELLLMESTAGTPTTYVQGRGSSVAGSSSAGAGSAEGFSYTSSASQYDGLVLLNRAGSGSYTLYRDTSAPNGSVTINNGDATTTSQDVTLSLPASDAQTGMMDMRVSVDGTLDSEPWQPYAASPSVTLPAGAGTKTVTVELRNNAGMTAAPVSDTIDLTGVPGGTSVASSTPSAGAVTVVLTAPDANGSPITGYSVSCASTDGGVARSQTGTTTTIKVSGLDGGKNYRCRARATNAAGTGAYGAYGATVLLPAATAPGGTPVASSTPSAGAVTVVLTPPDANGSPITGYSVSAPAPTVGSPGPRPAPPPPSRSADWTEGRTTAAEPEPPTQPAPVSTAPTAPPCSSPPRQRRDGRPWLAPRPRPVRSRWSSPRQTPTAARSRATPCPAPAPTAGSPGPRPAPPPPSRSADWTEGRTTAAEPEPPTQPAPASTAPTAPPCSCPEVAPGAGRFGLRHGSNLPARPGLVPICRLRATSVSSRARWATVGSSRLQYDVCRCLPPFRA